MLAKVISCYKLRGLKRFVSVFCFVLLFGQILGLFGGLFFMTYVVVVVVVVVVVENFVFLGCAQLKRSVFCVFFFFVPALPGGGPKVAPFRVHP